MPFLGGEVFGLEAVATCGSSSAYGVSAATPYSTGCEGPVRIEGSTRSDGLMRLSINREKYISSSMCCSCVVVLSTFWSTSTSFSLMALLMKNCPWLSLYCKRGLLCCNISIMLLLNNNSLLFKLEHKRLHKI